MATVRSIRATRAEPVSLQTHAMDNLRFIRETMERAGSFTAVPGWGGVAMGLSALVAAGIASQQPTLLRWLVTWLLEAPFAMTLAVLGHQAQSQCGERSAALGTGPALCSELRAAAAGGRIAHGRLVSRRFARGNPGDVAVALWNRGGHRRSIFSARGPGDGPVLHVIGRNCAILPVRLGNYVFGSRIRRAAPGVRNHYCQEVRWLDKTLLERTPLQKSREAPAWWPAKLLRAWIA